MYQRAYLRGTRSIASFETGHIGGAPVHRGSTSRPSISKDRRMSRKRVTERLDEVDDLRSMAASLQSSRSGSGAISLSRDI